MINNLIRIFWIFLLLRDSVIHCQTCKSLKTSNCYDLYGNPKRENELNYPCFASGVESDFCKCQSANAEIGDLELINQRMMCAKENRFVGEIWFDPDTCQKKLCNEEEKVVLVEGGCFRQDRNSNDPNKYCVPIGFYPFPCIYESKYYEWCRCERYDNETAVGKPEMCGTHLVGAEYESGCDKVVCQPDKTEKILSRKCQKSDGSCATEDSPPYPCYVHGLLRGACKCDRGCNVEIEVKRRYRITVNYGHPVDTSGKAVVSLSGTINETPVQRLDTIEAGRKSEGTFTAQYVGIPRKLVFQFEGRGGGTRKNIIVEDLDAGKRYEYPPKGLNQVGNHEAVSGEKGVYVETACQQAECNNTKTFTEITLEYKLMFYCPSVTNPNEELPLKRVRIALVGEHMFSGFLDLLNDDFLETTSSNKGAPIIFNGKYRFPYAGKIIELLIMFPDVKSIWRKTCTMRLFLPVRQQEFEFRLTVDHSDALERKLNCFNSPHCGHHDWDLVCDNGNLVDWCKKDECCSREKIPCGRLCYNYPQAYIGKWDRTVNNLKCATPCTKSEGTFEAPSCRVEGSNKREECDVPRCTNILFQKGKAYLVVDERQIRSAAKDICFKYFGGRLLMITDKQLHMKNVVQKFHPTRSGGYGLWIEGFYGLRSPAHWLNARHLFPRWVDETSPRDFKLLNTNDNGDLNGCLYGSDDEVWSTNCIRSAFPLCEVLLRS